MFLSTFQMIKITKITKGKIIGPRYLASDSLATLSMCSIIKKTVDRKQYSFSNRG